MIQLHQIKKPKIKKEKRVGRGGKKGTYSGRGIKGQKARAGRKMYPQIREIIKKIPKLRGWKFKAKEKPEWVNLKDLERKFKENEIVSPKTLVEKGLLKKRMGKIPLVKILGKGEIKKPILIKDCLLSKKAKEKIEKAGGKIL